MRKLKQFLPIIVLVVIAFSIYAFNLHNGLFWDDDDWILNNKFVHSISWDNIKFWFTHNTLAGVGMKSNYYRPFLFFTFAINYLISGVKPLSYHLLSNLTHIANGVLVFSILYLVLRKKLVALLTALIFLIHPLQTEAVTYISGRGDPLYVFFMLLAFWLFVKMENLIGKKRLLYLVFSLVSLVLALLSREVAIIFPLLLIVFYVSFISKDKFSKSLKAGIVKSAPYLAIVMIYGILRLTVLNFLNTLNFYTVHNVYADHFYVRIFTFLKVLIVYFRLLIAPIGLHMERGMDPQLSFWKWPVWAVFTLLIVLMVWLVFLYRKKGARLQSKDEGLWRFSDFQIWFFGVTWFFIGLAPVSGITPINAILYEHWLYLPMIGPFLIVAFYVDKLIFIFKEKKQLAPFCLVVVVLTGYLSFLGAQSIRRNIAWGKPVDFYLDILKYEPDSVRINNNLGNLYFDNRDVEKAQEFYQRAVASEDVFPQPHYNLGSILESEGDIFGAMQEYEKAIKIDPDFYFPYPNLVSIYARQGNLVKAAEYVIKLNELRPNDPRILYNAALIFAAQNRLDLALQAVKQGLVYVGSDAEVRKALEDFEVRLTKKK